MNQFDGFFLRYFPCVTHSLFSEDKQSAQMLAKQEDASTFSNPKSDNPMYQNDSQRRNSWMGKTSSGNGRGGGRGGGGFRGKGGRGGRGNYNFGKKRGGWSSGGRGKKRSYPSSGSPATSSGSSLSTAAPPPPPGLSSSSSSAGFFGKAPASKKPHLGLMKLPSCRPGAVSKKPLL